MARLLPARCYRKLERPYTRKSRYRKYSYVKSVPQSRITMFDMGDPKLNYKYQISLVMKDSLQIRHNALEAARVIANKYLKKKFGRDIYYFKIKIYPHHILRWNPMATGAGADRFQQGMRRAFGRPIGLAAQVRKNQEIMFIRVLDDKDIEIAKEALRRAASKLPGDKTIQIREL